MSSNILWFNEIELKDIDKVGGKNASLGEMLNHLSSLGIQVPEGFATTAQAYHNFLAHNGLAKKIESALTDLDVENITALSQAGQKIRQWIMDTPYVADFISEVTKAYEKLTAGINELSFAVRSSATAEDLPDASFAGQQETFLNVFGLDNILHSIKQVFASLYNDRAIAYRVHHGFMHDKVGISVGIQRMVRSDKGASGVMFTIDTESGFKDVVFINANYGLGETVVQGSVNPDEFYVYKKSLTEKKPAI